MKVLLRILPFVVGAVAHVQLISPMTRNTVDRNLPQWKGGRFGNDNCNRTAWQYTCCMRPGKHRQPLLMFELVSIVVGMVALTPSCLLHMLVQGAGIATTERTSATWARTSSGSLRAPRSVAPHLMVISETTDQSKATTETDVAVE